MSYAAISTVGLYTHKALESVGRSARFVNGVVRSAASSRDWFSQVTLHARVLGVGSLPIGMFIALFTGIVLALLASYSVGDLVPPYFVGTLVQKTVTLELAPVLTGLALAGRVGANIAAELGTMRVTEQIDAMEVSSINPFKFF